MRLDTSWQKFKNNLLQLPEIQVPRFVNIDVNKPCQIHGFSDASMRAYGACVYIRNETSEGVKVSLLTAKSKVAPLKTKSLPRLELCASHLLVKLVSRIRPMLNTNVEKVIFWTDSEIALHWIKSHPSTLSTFVGNRVAEIQELSEAAFWRHVPTKQNPADIVSRGCNVDELASSIWFTGPEFLLDAPERWPQNAHFELSAEVVELESRKNPVALLATKNINNDIVDVIDKFSSHLKLVRIFVYMLRFIKKCRRKPMNCTLVPTAQEMKLAFIKIVQVIQQFEFETEIVKLKKQIALPPNLQKLNPFLHEDTEDSIAFSVIRVGGRLMNAPIPYDAKFPLILSKDSRFLKNYLKYLHVRNFHA